MLNNLHLANGVEVNDGLKNVQDAAINNQNMFEQLMQVCKVASLGQITSALFEVGGQYRRNM
jgi:methylmalonyl-CoA mutase